MELNILLTIYYQYITNKKDNCKQTPVSQALTPVLEWRQAVHHTLTPAPPSSVYTIKGFKTKTGKGSLDPTVVGEYIHLEASVCEAVLISSRPALLPPISQGARYTVHSWISWLQGGGGGSDAGIETTSVHAFRRSSY